MSAGQTSGWLGWFSALVSQGWNWIIIWVGFLFHSSGNELDSMILQHAGRIQLQMVVALSSSFLCGLLAGDYSQFPASAPIPSLGSLPSIFEDSHGRQVKPFSCFQSLHLVWPLLPLPLHLLLWVLTLHVKFRINLSICKTPWKFYWDQITFTS
jgi:hypothetical protein